MSSTGCRRVNDIRIHGLAIGWRNCVSGLDVRLMPRNCSNVGIVFLASTRCDIDDVIDPLLRSPRTRSRRALTQSGNRFAVYY